MKSIILRDHEVRRLLSVGGVTVVREVTIPSDLVKPEMLAHKACRLTLNDYDPALHRGVFATVRHPSGGSSGPYICPIGAPGEQRWVRETWAALDRDWRPYDGSVSEAAGLLHSAYRADYDDPRVDAHRFRPRWRSPATMPDWASRAVVEVASVSVVRLHDVSLADMEASGAVQDLKRHTTPDGHDSGTGRYVHPDGRPSFSTARGCFALAWNEQRGATKYANNPWVWVAPVTRVEAA